jgi:hypothetical protein
LLCVALRIADSAASRRPGNSSERRALKDKAARAPKSLERGGADSAKCAAHQRTISCAFHTVTVICRAQAVDAAVNRALPRTKSGLRAKGARGSKRRAALASRLQKRAPIRNEPFACHQATRCSACALQSGKASACRCSFTYTGDEERCCRARE